MDFSSFSGENFNPKEWINKSFQTCNGEPKEAFASSMVLKLQLFIQEVNNALEATAQQANLNLPRIIKEAEAMGEEAKFLQEQMVAIKEDISRVENGSISTISMLDSVKSRMLEANKALREADNWSTLSSGVEEVFQSGDIEAIASKLVGMQRCLEILQNVPDYEERCKLLEQHKNRLEALLTPQIISAFNSHSLDVTLMYTKIFKDINRLKELQKYYHDCHKEHLLKQWSQIREVDPDETLAEWLNNFFDILLSTWHNQLSWCSQVFAQADPAEILLELLVDVILTLDPNLPSSLQDALKQSQQPLPFFIDIKKIIDRFAKSIQIALPPQAIKSAHTTALLQALYSPIRSHMDNYASLEENQLLSGLHIKSGDLLHVVNALEDSVSKAQHLITEADVRCKHLSHGFALPALIKAYKSFYEKYLDYHREVVNKVKQENKDSSKDVWTLFQLVMNLLQISGSVLLQLKEVQGSLCSQLEAVKNMRAQGDRDPFNSYDLFLLSSSLKTQLKELLYKYEDEGIRFQPLHSSICSFQQHSSSLRLLLFDVSFKQVQSQLKSVPSLPIWQDKGEENSAVEELPSFSVSPQEYVTQIGQYLMTLPQHIDPYVIQENPALLLALNTDHDNVAQCILGQLGTQTLHHYVDAILQIPHLAQRAVPQLTADIDYLRDVLDDLGLSTTENLLTIRELVSCNASDFLIKSKGKPNFITLPIKAMRKL